MTKNYTISGEHLDRSHSIRAKQTLKTRQLTLTLQHKPDNRALHLRIGPLHHPERNPSPVPRRGQSPN
ncbi:MAG TPA: hypothetical protein VGI24_10405 [Solirubrobacteraceae bacterium]